MPPPKRPDQQALVDRWNEHHETVVPVHYRRDDGAKTPTATRSKAFVLSGHTACIFVDGVGGCVALERLTERT